MTRSRLPIRVLGRGLPGLRFGDNDRVQVGVQRGREVVDPVPGDAAEAVFDLSVDVVRTDEADLDFRGPYVHGRRGDRFLYLSWGQATPDGGHEMFRRAKLGLSAPGAALVEKALASGGLLQAELGFTDDRGGPLCASVPETKVTWRVV